MSEAVPPSPPPVVEIRQPAAPARPAEPTRWHSDRLFGERVEIEIEHGGSIYRLRKTALGKLILTK